MYSLLIRHSYSSLGSETISRIKLCLICINIFLFFLWEGGERCMRANPFQAIIVNLIPYKIAVTRRFIVF